MPCVCKTVGRSLSLRLVAADATGCIDYLLPNHDGVVKIQGQNEER